MISFIQYDSGAAPTIRLRNATSEFWNFVLKVWVSENSAPTNVAYTESPHGDGTSLYTVNIVVPLGGPFIQEAVLPTGDVIGTDVANSDAPATPGVGVGEGGTYTSLGEVALFLNIDVAALTPTENAQIGMLIAHVEGVINNYCGYTLGAKDYTDKRFDGSGTSSLDLNAYVVNAVTSVREKNADATFTDWTSSIEILNDGVIQFLPEIGGTFTAGIQNFFISYSAGFQTTPPEIAFAATYLVAINFSKINQYLIGISEQGATNMNTKYDSIELPVLVKRVLDRYRKISIF